MSSELKDDMRKATRVPREQLEAENAEALLRRWGPKAKYSRNPALQPGTWTVDGNPQQEALTEDALQEALSRAESERPLVEVGAPEALILARIIGRSV